MNHPDLPGFLPAFTGYTQAEGVARANINANFIAQSRQLLPDALAELRVRAERIAELMKKPRWAEVDDAVVGLCFS